MIRSKKILIVSILILLLIGILIYIKKNTYTIVELNQDNMSETLEKNDYSVVYMGGKSKLVTKKLKSYYDDYKVNLFVSSYNIDDFIEDYNVKDMDIKKNVYILFEENTPMAIVGNDETDQKIFYKYLYNVIPDDEIEYKVLSTADEYIKKVNSNKLTVAVFGKKTCNYCTLYLNTINEEAKNRKLNIYYFDADTFDADEYNKIIDELNFTIPDKCSTKDYDSDMVNGFDKPLTIITKKGEMVDCVLGYVSVETLDNKLKEVGVINEK